MTLFVGKKKKMKATVSGDMQKMKDKQSNAILWKGSSDDYEKFEIPHAVSGIDEKKAVDDLYLAWETVNPKSVPLSLKVAMTKLKIENLKQQVQSLNFPPHEYDEETASESSASAGVDEISEKRAEIVPYADCVEASYKHKNLEKEETGLLPTSPSVIVDDDLSHKCHSEIVARRVDDVSRKCNSEIVRYHTDSPNSMIEEDQFNYLKEARSFDTGAGNSSIATDSDSIDTAKGSWGIWKRRNIDSGDGGGSASSSSKKPKDSNSTKKSKNSKGRHLVVTVDSDDNASESSSKKSKNSTTSKKSKGSKGSLVGKVGSFFKNRSSKKTTTSATAKKAQKKQEDVVATDPDAISDTPSKCVEEKQKKVPEPTTENKIVVSTHDASRGKNDKIVNYETIVSLLESKSFDSADRSCNTLDTAEGSWGLWKDERFFAALDEHDASANKKASSENVNVLLEAGIMLKKWSENVATDFRASSEKVLTKTKHARDDIERRCFTAMESTSARSNIGSFQRRELLGSSSSLFGGEGNPPGESYLDAVVDHFSRKLNMTCDEALDNASSNLQVAVSESDPRKYLCFATQDDEYYPDEYYPAAERKSQVGSNDSAPGITRTPSILKPPDQMKYTRSGSDLAGDPLPTYSNKQKHDLLSFVLPGDF